MSAGHGHHRRINEKNREGLNEITSSPDFQKMWARPYTVIDTKQIPDTAGYSVDGSHYYRDRVLVQAVRGGHITVPNMKPDDILDAVLIHERVEKCTMDADNPIDYYLDAHEYATLAEHEFVRSLGASPRQYEEALAPVISFNEKKPLTDVPLDLACSPYLDDPDEHDKAALKEMIKLGVQDAEKRSKEDVDYGKAKPGGDECVHCVSWVGAPTSELAPCRKVCGAVRATNWCKLFEAEKEDDNGEAYRIQGSGSTSSEEPEDQEPRSSGGSSGA